MIHRNYLPWFVPLFLLILFAPFSPWIDQRLAGHFYQNGSFVQNSMTDFFYYYGEFPAFVTAGGAALLLCLSFFPLGIKLKKWRAGLLTLVLTLALGAGLLINGILKEYIARPRPKQTESYGGEYPFRPFYQPQLRSHVEESQKSFPSGHAAMGFYFFALLLVAKRYGYTSIFYLGVALTLFMGLGLMCSRVMQGGHYFSDTLVSAALMWWVAYGCHRLTRRMHQLS